MKVRWDEPGSAPDLPKVLGISMPNGEGPWATFIDAATATASEGDLEASVSLSSSNAAEAANQFDSFL